MFYGFSNEAGQYVSEQCLVQPLYSSEGGPPTWSQWWSKYCYMATSPFLARRVNCGRTAGLCYLSLPPDHRAEAWGGEDNHPPPHTHTYSLPSPSRPGSQLMVVDVSGLGWTWPSPTVFQAEDKPLTPLWSRRQSEAQREWGAYWRPCHRMTPSVSFPVIQDIRQSAPWEGTTCSDDTYWNIC